MGSSHSTKNQSKKSNSKNLNKNIMNSITGSGNNHQNNNSFVSTTAKYTPELFICESSEDNRPSRIFAADLHDDSLCCSNTKNINKLNQHFNDYDFNPSMECCGEFDENEPADNYFYQENEEGLDSSNEKVDNSQIEKQVIPAIMEPNWLLSDEIQMSSLLQRRQQHQMRLLNHNNNQIGIQI